MHSLMCRRVYEYSPQKQKQYECNQFLSWFVMNDKGTRDVANQNKATDIGACSHVHDIGNVYFNIFLINIGDYTTHGVGMLM